MAHKHAAIKALRQAKKAVVRNRAMALVLKNLRKQALTAVAAGKADEAREKARLFGKAADKAVQKGILKRNTGARLKSRLAVALGKVK